MAPVVAGRQHPPDHGVDRIRIAREIWAQKSFDRSAGAGKTPVLDIGALAKIKAGEIKVVPAIKRFSHSGVEFINGEYLNLDDVILATGYKINVPSWLHESDFFCKNGFPKTALPNSWKGQSGLYAVDFCAKGWREHRWTP
ncbi:unnamed protein product [Rhodiola kirilowii]